MRLQTLIRQAQVPGKRVGIHAHKPKKPKRQMKYCIPIFVWLHFMAYTSCGPELEHKDRLVDPRPNFIIILTDDQGYGDLGKLGGRHVQTPFLDEMASKGTLLTHFYSAAALCSPSRAALLTGTYPFRNDMATGSTFPVLLAADSKGLHPEEITMAEVLREAGYTTGIIGKWHLGDQPEFLPTNQGFDEFFGLPYSHDIHPYHPRQAYFNFPPLPLLEGDSIIEIDPDAKRLTQRFTERAENFIRKNKDRPFFLYLPHILPHHPIQVSERFMNSAHDSIKRAVSREKNTVDYTARGGLYPQAISEIDNSVHTILTLLDSLQIARNTLVIFTSDNGPDGAYGGIPLGSAGPFRGRKGSTLEGGFRMPAIAYWPGKIPAGQVNTELMTTMDFLPTFAKLGGAELPADRVIDGKDIMPVLLGDLSSPHHAFFYFKENALEGIRVGKLKLRFKKGTPAELYDLSEDPGEKINLINRFPDVVKELTSITNSFSKEIIENRRPSGYIKNPSPLVATDNRFQSIK